MRLLVLGGTKFLGRGIVDAALASGHDVTLFNRGETNPGLYRDVESLRGDRHADLSALAGREWDAVIDPSGYFPRDRPRVGRAATRVGRALRVRLLDLRLRVPDRGRSGRVVRP